MNGDRKAKTPAEISIKRAANGGFIVRHAYDNYGAGESYMPPKEHAFSGHKAMMAHVHKHTGGTVDTETDPQPAGRASAETSAADQTPKYRTPASPKKVPPTGSAPGPRSRGAGMD